MFDYPTSTPLVQMGLMLLGIIGSIVYLGYRLELLRRISITGTVFITFTVMHGLSALPYAMGWSPAGEILVPVSPHFAISLGLAFICFTLGVAVTANVSGFRVSQAQDRFFSQPLNQTGVNLLIFAILAVLTVVVSYLYVTYKSRFGLELLVSEAKNVHLLREFRSEMAQENRFGYFGGLARNIFIPLLLLTSINAGVFTRQLTWRIVAVVLLLVALLVSTAAVHKGPIVILVLYIVINHVIRKRLNDFKIIRLGLLIGTLVLVLGAAGYYLTYATSDMFDALSDTVRRIFYIPQVCYNQFLLVYPDMVDYHNGLGIGLIARIAQREYIPPSQLVPGVLWGWRRTWYANANTFWAGDLWANFGYPGVVIGSTLVGAMLVVVDFWCLHRRRSALSISVYAVLLVTAVRFPSASVFTQMLSGGIVTVPLLSLLLGLGASSPSSRSAANSGAASLSPSESQ